MSFIYVKNIEYLKPLDETFENSPILLVSPHLTPFDFPFTPMFCDFGPLVIDYELELTCSWPWFPSGTFTDSSEYSDLNFENAPNWSVLCLFDDKKQPCFDINPLSWLTLYFFELASDVKNKENKNGDNDNLTVSFTPNSLSGSAHVLNGISVYDACRSLDLSKVCMKFKLLRFYF